MRSFRRLGFLAFFFAAFVAGAWFATAPTPVLAQIDTGGLQEVGAATQLTGTDPRVIAVRIINIALGLLGIITLTIVVYAGFLYMTAGGDAEKVETAKKWLRNGLIGLIIILSSWALTSYILRSLLTATGGGGGTTTGGPGGPGGGFGGGPSSGFQVQSISPTGTTTIRNIEVRFLFTRNVSAASAAAQITVVRVSDNAPVAGSSTVFGSLVTFVPTAACPAPNADRHCLDADTQYEAQVGGSLQSSDGRTISCGGFAPPCRVRFTSGNLVDTAVPSVQILSPFNGESVNASDTVRILSRATDDSGVSYLETTADGTLIDRASPTATSTPTAYDGAVVWDPSGLSLGAHNLQSRAYDIDSNNGSSPLVNVALRAGHCFNAVRDADETALDCGGRDCGACSGGSCTSGTDCRSGVCSGGVCVEQPIITGITPGNGRTGTFVTISGVNFGTSGSVYFWSGASLTVVASAPSACTGAVSWSPTQVLVAVPDAARSGPIRLTNGGSRLSDDTNDTNGPTLGDYAVNDVARPGLCAIIPPSAVADAEASFRGVGFGASQGATDRVIFNDGSDRDVTTYGSWSDREVRIVTPRFSPATYSARVQAGGADSNTLDFTLAAPVVTTPIIDSIDPTATSVGSYVTINGRNFGDRPGTVRFVAQDGSGGVGFGEIPSVAQCAGAWWRDTSIVVKVPSVIGTPPLTRPTAAGRFEIRVVRPDAGSPTSNGAPFTVRTGAASPGICAIEPIAGPAGVSTTIYGDLFGASADRVTFEGALGRINATVGSWTPNQIAVTVPSTARTGAVRVSVGTETSNGVNFQVRSCLENPEQICGANRQCCANGTCAAPGARCAEAPTSAQYAWQTSTGEIPVSPRVVESCDVSTSSPPPPSPSPWSNRADGTNVCLNAAIAVRFTTRLDPASINGNFSVRKCTGTGNDPCASGTPVEISGAPELRNVSASSDYLYFRAPGGAWDPNATYAITLRTGIRSLNARVAMEENPGCGAGASYCFRFVTGGADARCLVTRVTVTPNPFTAQELNQQISYNSVPMTKGCLVLDDTSVNWNWYTGRGSAPGQSDDRATITNNAIGGVVSSTQIATALQETGARSIPIHAAAIGPPLVIGTSDLYVAFAPPTVVAFEPNCTKACVNAELNARFNVSMDVSRVTSRQIILRRCENENCTSYDPATPLALCDSGISLATSTLASGLEVRNQVVINPTDPARGCAASQLQAGSYYRVTLKNGTDGFFSRTGLPLDVSHAGSHASPEGFTWTFRVKSENGGLCTANRVDVVPGEKYETLIGARQLFTAQPYSAPDECSEAGQRLAPTDGFTWNVQDRTVARLMPGSTGSLIDTSPNLPAGCSNRCLNAGSQGQAGQIASCGNDVVETTDTHYCRRPDGTACRVGDTNCRIKAPYDTPTNGACVLMPSGSQGSEECDLGPGNRNGAPGAICGASCLWTGNTGAQCGNGALDRGEQCDAKERVCGQGSNQGSVCSTDADCGTGRCNELRDRPGCTASCLLTGTNSQVASVCGEGTIGYGEACDEGDLISGDGCSSVCLHEGSSRVASTCGNGVPEPGESCERRADGTWPAHCDQRTCLNEGTASCADTPGSVGCCGNRIVEAGEDCDGTPGCSSRCLLLGSSASYATPSFCGDGTPSTLGTGEQCEASTDGDGLIDATQLAEIVGEGTVSSDLRMSTRIQSGYQTANGTATYGVQCGRTSESECNPGGGTAIGLTNQGCCMRRPQLTDAIFPEPGSTNVCRNSFMFAEFDQRMDEGSISNNFILAEESAGAACATGTQPLNDVPRASRDWRSVFASIWERIVGFFTGKPAEAQVWCVGRVSGTVRFEDVFRGGVTTTRMTFTVNDALRPNTRYQIVFRGDTNLADAAKHGVRNANGVVMAGDSTWTFTTGERICAANQVSIRDANEQRPFLFQSADEQHIYSSTIQSLQNGRLVPIVPVSQYHWSWDPWRSQIPSVLDTVGASLTDPLNRQSTSTIQADNHNGSALIFAGIRIDRDTVNVPSTTGTAIGASQLSSVILCQRPWPFAAPMYRGTGAVRFEDSVYHFSTLYCMDGADVASTTDDLPPMVAHTVTSTSRDVSRGILRQYFFDYPTATDPLLRHDAIGIRVIANPLHLSALSWYQSQGFRGQPKPVTVDGYDGIEDGTTIYVAAVNTASDPNAGFVSSTIYLISYNDDAQPLTKQLFKQLVDNWTFNINLTVLADNSCKRPDGSSLIVNGRFVECTADWECALTPGVTATCASIKAKLQRDTVRIAHFQDMMGKLENAKLSKGTYPTIASGSFIQNMTNSRWPSWQSALGSELGGSVPQDPINRFLTCGRCKGPTGALGKTCMEASECAAGETCSAEVGGDPTYNGFDPGTCWNATSQRFLCPQLDRPVVGYPSLPSRYYQYRSIDGGARYELSTELEGPKPTRYAPALVQEIKQCAGNGPTRLCQTNSDCPIPGGFATCVGTGGRWVYKFMCSASVYGADNVCGNHVLGAGELCESGDTHAATCTTADGRPGTKIQSCSECRNFVDTAATVCTPDQTCGNGVTERYKCYGGAGYRYGQSCRTPTAGASPECTDPRDASGLVMRCESVSLHGGSEETCDDGALNGTYGHCNRTCTALGATCGDNQLSLGETCDNGQDNGRYCDTAAGCVLANSCSTDCRSRAPYCGDRVIQAASGEQCDGNAPQRTITAICYDGSRANEPCTTAADCPGATWGCGLPSGDPFAYAYEACSPVQRCTNDRTRACATDANCVSPGICATYPQQHTRRCDGPETPANQCRWEGWSECLPANYCGDGVVDPGEQCDDGNANNNDACTNACRRNICGDGVMNVGVEQCDRGVENGQACTADYGSTCARCSTTCQQEAQSGGYCGDGIQNGAEQCDRADIPPTTCRALGFDYANQISCQQYSYTTDNTGRLLCVGVAGGGPNWDQCAACQYRNTDGTLYDGYKVYTAGTSNICITSVTTPRTPIPGGPTYQACTGSCQFHAATTAPGPVDSSFSATCSDTATEFISCSNTCGYTGCGRCSDAPGPADTDSVSGTVFDAVYSIEPVPNARVTLYYQGVRVTQTFTDSDGRFTLSGINKRSECGNYRIIVDSYVDNPCTPLTAGATRPSCNASPVIGIGVNEGRNGGYWPFQSRTFSASTFNSLGLENANGRIFLVPRVAAGETLVVTSWNGTLPALCPDSDHNGEPDCYRYVDAHLVLPQNYFYPGTTDRRDVNYAAPGFPDIARTDPHARLFCYHSDRPSNPDGTPNETCGSFKDAPQTTIFRRGNWTNGSYYYFLGDYYQNANITNTHNYFRDQQIVVRVVTQETSYEVRPSLTASETCGNGKDWLVFKQDALTGALTIPGTNGTGQFVCLGDTVPGETGNVGSMLQNN